MKYKNGLVRQIREKQEFQQQQENIKKSIISKMKMLLSLKNLIWLNFS